MTQRQTNPQCHRSLSWGVGGGVGIGSEVRQIYSCSINAGRWVPILLIPFASSHAWQNFNPKVDRASSINTTTAEPYRAPQTYDYCKVNVERKKIQHIPPHPLPTRFSSTHSSASPSWNSPTSPFALRPRSTPPIRRWKGASGKVRQPKSYT